MNYTQFVDSLSIESGVRQDNAALVANRDTIILQAENMIYREPGLEYFISSAVSDSTGFTTPNVQQFQLPQFFIELKDVYLINGNDRPSLTMISRTAMNYFYSNRVAAAMSDVPTKWAPFTDQIILLGPTPGNTYGLECVGRVRPQPLSGAYTPWLWANLGDLAFAAAMYFMCAQMKNFGAQADDPKMAVSWKDTYDKLLPGAVADETRRRYGGAG